LAPFDPSTAEGRAKERYRRIVLSALGSGLAKVISIATMLVSVPLTLNYLGLERYGLWMIISSVIAMMGFADMGIGNGLMNIVAESYGKSERVALRRHISSALVMLSGISALLLLVFITVYPHVAWAELFNVESPAATEEAGPALMVFVICFALSIPTSIVQRVQLGLQMGFENSFWQIVGSVLGLVLTLFGIYFEGSLPWLVAAMAGGPIIASLVNGAWFFLQQRELLPLLGHVTRDSIIRVSRTGLLFFFLQIGVTVAYASDNIIIGRILGPESVAVYSVISRMFEGSLLVLGILFAPLWPAYGEAKARGDKIWIKQTLIRSMQLTLILVLGVSAFLVVFNRTILEIWIGEHFIYSLSLVAWYGIWVILKGLGSTYSMFLNGMNIIGAQLMIMAIFVVFSTFLKIYSVYSVGIEGVPIASVLSYFIFVVLPYAFITQSLLARS
jgi:O-antigen/teichoic acid export membrane protein